MKILKKVIMVLVVMFGAFFVMNTSAYAGYKDMGWNFIREEGIFKRESYYCKIFKDDYIHTHVIKEITPVIYHQQGIETKLDFEKDVFFMGAVAQRDNWSRGYNSEAWATSKVIDYVKGSSYLRPFNFDSSTYGGTILKNDKSGYYKLAACQNFIKYQIRMYQKNKCVRMIDVFLPTGEAYLKVMYGGNSKLGSKFV